jgi:hypothetical protein
MESKTMLAHYHVFCLATIVALVATLESRAAIVAQYTFNNETVWETTNFALDGTLVDNTDLAFYRGGRLYLTNNNGLGSNQDFSNPATAGAYVDLPNGLLNSASNQGTSGAFSLEMWITVDEHRNWARAADLGSGDPTLPNGGENDSSGGATRDYVIVVPQTGLGADETNAALSFAASTHVLTGEESFARDPAGPIATGVAHHIVFAVDQNDTQGDTNPYGTQRLYLNNQLVATAPVAELSNFNFTQDVNNWLGRAQWPDPLFDGQYDEFRIHNTALTAGEINDNYLEGPVPVPTMVIDRATGEVSFTNMAGPMGVDTNLAGYTISSPGGVLDTAEFTSIDAGNAFDPVGTWNNVGTPSATMLGEATNGSGGVLSPGELASIGNVWNRSPIEDITFAYSFDGVDFHPGDVVYLGDAAIRSDLDADGDIDADDYAIFAAGQHSDLTGLSPFQSYFMGDLNGDGLSNYFDFRLFKDDFIAFNSPEAFAALLSGASVPEPTSLLLAGLAVAGALAARKRKPQA